MPRKFVIADNVQDPHAIFAEMMLRWMSRPWNRDPDQYPAVYIGMIPQEVYSELPLSHEISLLGSIARSPDVVEIFADATGSPAEVAKSLVRNLSAEGWSRLEWHDAPGGIMPGPPADQIGMTLCKSKEGPLLSVKVLSSDDSRCELRLDFEGHPMDRCDPELRKRIMRANTAGDLMPYLTAPSGTWVTGGSGMGANDSRSTSAILKSKNTPEDITNHFAGQLTEYGWTLQTSVHNSDSSVTYWEFTDPSGLPCVGFLDVKKVEDRSGLRYVNLIVSRMGKSLDAF